MVWAEWATWECNSTNPVNPLSVQSHFLALSKLHQEPADQKSAGFLLLRSLLDSAYTKDYKKNFIFSVNSDG